MLAPTGLGTVYYAYVDCIPTTPRLHGLKRWFSILVAVNVVNILTFLVRAPSTRTLFRAKLMMISVKVTPVSPGSFAFAREAEARILVSRTLL